MVSVMAEFMEVMTVTAVSMKSVRSGSSESHLMLSLRKCFVFFCFPAVITEGGSRPWAV